MPSRLFLYTVLLLAAAAMFQARARNLDVYWIDVEGGAATLIVSPSGESFLIDTGWAVGDRVWSENRICFHPGNFRLGSGSR
jgi:beta-lactamase superfamily II metal-dependent hydrolase